MARRTILGSIGMVGFVGAIFLANWLLLHVGLIPVFPGILAPAGVIAAGLTFFFRDMIQRQIGIGWAGAGILIGAILSAFLSPHLAIASGLAFMLSEGLDLLVYTPVREYGEKRAVALSNVVGFVADSVIFLVLGSFVVPYLSLAQLPGQLIGKAYATAAVLLVLWGLDVLSERRGESPDARDAGALA